MCVSGVQFGRICGYVTKRYTCTLTAMQNGDVRDLFLSFFVVVVFVFVYKICIQYIFLLIVQ